jgi:hypothetical protein
MLEGVEMPVGSGSGTLALGVTETPPMHKIFHFFLPPLSPGYHATAALPLLRPLLGCLLPP